MLDVDAFGHQFAEGVGEEIQRLGSATMAGSGLRLDVGVVTMGQQHLQPPDRNEAEYERWALSIVQESNSDFLLTGTIEVTTAGTEVIPLLYVSPSRVPDSPELGGWYSASEALFVPSDVSDNSVTLGQAYVSLSTSMVTLIELGSILEALELNSPLEAAERLQGLAENGEFHIVPKPLVYLFLGNALGQSACLQPTSCDADSLSAATESYRKALSLDPASLRAKIGLAEVELQLAQNDCGVTAQPDVGSLAQAQKMFEEAVNPERVTAVVLAKASLGISRVVSCRVSAGLTDDDSTVVRIAEQLVHEAETQPGCGCAVSCRGAVAPRFNGRLVGTPSRGYVRPQERHRLNEGCSSPGIMAGVPGRRSGISADLRRRRGISYLWRGVGRL
jgi:hypothetical protein